MKNKLTKPLTIILSDYLPTDLDVRDYTVYKHPMSNKFPVNQCIFLENITTSINAGIETGVCIVTLSPYLMAHLNNLISGSKDDKIKAHQANFLYTKNSKAFIDIDSVDAFECKAGDLFDLKDNDFGIKWTSLSDVSSDLQQKYFEIFEADTK